MKPNRPWYHFKFELERLMLRGTLYRLIPVALMLILLSITGGVLVWASGSAFPEAHSLPSAIWWAFLRLSDPGYLGDDVGAIPRIVSTVLTVLGYVIFVGALVAVMTQALQSKLRNLESGLTPIVENGHVLILGWTDRSRVIVRELMLSQARVRRFLQLHNTKRLRIVILAAEVTSVVRNSLRTLLGKDWSERQIIFRTGTPLSIEDLERVDFAHASVVLLPAADFGTTEWVNNDTRAVKTLLSLSNRAVAHVPGEAAPSVVAEVLDERNLDIAKRSYAGEIEVLASDAIVARLIAQNIRHEGLSVIYNELLTHGSGCEIYVRRCADLTGTRFQDAHGIFPDAALLGVVRRSEAGFVPILNPEPGFCLEAGDLVVVMAESYESSGPEKGAQPRPLVREAQAEVHEGLGERRVLVLGWSHKVPALLREFGLYRTCRFQTDILSIIAGDDRASALARAGVGTESVRHLTGDYTSAGELVRLEVDNYDNIILIGSDWLKSGEESDARTIMGYVQLRSILQSTARRPHVLVELLDPANEVLFRERKDEVLISPMILAHMLAQVALRRELRVVFDELFGPSGVEIDFQPAARFLEGTVSPVRYEDVRNSVLRRGLTPLGLRVVQPNGQGAKVHLNPRADTEWRFSPEDEVVILRT